MLLSLEEFCKIFPKCREPEAWCQAINDVAPEFGIMNGPRLWMFLAQCGHESAGLTVFQENLNYSRDALLRVFPKYFNRGNVDMYARKPQMIANRVYANRMGNGPEESGDGWRFRGKGPIQITGAENTLNFSEYWFKDRETVLKNPEVLLEPDVGIAAACWFWKTRNLNELCDMENIVAVTKRINGGTHGLEDRQNRYAYVKSLLS